jgi:two-component system, NtrC family, sensor kinase
MDIKKKLVFICIFLCCKHLIYAQNNYADSLKKQLASAKEDVTRVDLLENLARIYIFSYPDTAEGYAKQGLQLAENLHYVAGEAGCMMALCLSLTFSGDYVGALDYGLKALPLNEYSHDSSLLAWNNIQVMTCYRELEDYDQALIYSNNARKLLKSFHPDPNQVSVALGVTGSVYEKRNQVDSALYYELKAFAIDTSWSQLFQFIGDAYTKSGRADLALNYYKRGLLISRRDNNLIGFVDLNNGISRVFELNGQVDSAISYASASIRHPGINNNARGLLEASVLLARLYEIQGNSDSTIKYLKTSNTLKDSLYSRKKTREAQTFAFNERLHQRDLIAQHQRDENRIKIAVLLAIILIFLLVVFFLWRNNKQKQKAKNKIEKAYSDLKLTQAQLVQSEKMASLGELTAGIAHEIQNPLNFVNNFSEVNTELINELEQEADKGNIEAMKSLVKDIKGNEQKINQHGKRADSIVKGMLQHSRTSSGQKEATDINALCDEYLRLAYHGLRAKDPRDSANKSFSAKLETNFDNSIGRVNIVPQEIGRVILNLINNAFYAVADRQRMEGVGYEPMVTITTRAIIPPLGGQRGAEITVADNGVGIPDSIKEKIFQPFFTTKPTGQGTGLGLSLAYDMVKAHGGEIKVVTREGEGSEFVIQLPVSSNIT